MKKKIAVCANGWNYDTLYDALLGIKEYASVEDFDIFVFLSYASYSEYSTLSEGELNIYKLMNPEDYDGIIVFSTALNSVETAVSICNTALQKHIPVVSIGMEIDGVNSVCVNNETGMRELVDHLIEQHDVRRAFFIGGTHDHVDSIARLRVTREEFESHGLEFTDEDYGYGRWTNRYTAELIDEMLDSDRGLPDAIICANDIMAMAACTELEERGVDVPREVIVTGFDNCREGKMFYPALSSVEQNYHEIGYRSCKIIFDEIRRSGRDNAVRELVHSCFACGESCRCRGEIDFEAQRILYCRHSYKRSIYAKLLEQNERVMRQWLTEMPSYDILKETLCGHYERNHQFEGEGFYICVNDGFFRDVMVSEKELWEKGSSAKIETLVALCNGEIVNGLEASTGSIVPGYDKKAGEQHVYFFLPMHYFEYNYGYVVLTDFPYLIREDMLYPYMEKLQQSIRYMRTNLRLKELYDKDQMTGLFNRFGYENKAIPLYEESLEQKKKIMVMFVDINYMKLINDKYGHLHGDNAIMTVVAAINENIGDGAIAVRFGGDEFLIIAPDCDEDKAAHTKEALQKYLEDANKEKKEPYDISASIGYVVSNPVSRPGAGLQDYIREADKLMYEIKKEMHMKNDRRKR
ncbi:MAG: GGDEF domain-containing protein [Lachnospiraceae bacterium]|nr:GGDEF domain-containing protein [Lachnospiraceae bacterium]